MEASSWVPVQMCGISRSEIAGESPCLKLFVAVMSTMGAGLWRAGAWLRASSPALSLSGASGVLAK